jgi:large subunit ribosomal protein L15
VPKAKPKTKPKARGTRVGRTGGAARAKRTTRPTSDAPKGEVPHLSLSNLTPPRGSHRARIRKGRGPGSGIGKTAGRGGKGQTARTGGQTRPGFEGGQMPLIRRIPKRGFTNPFKQPAQVVNVRHLDQLAEGVEVTPETLFGAGLVRRPDHPIKLLGMGDVRRKFSVTGVTVSASARAKIEQAGGTIAS